MLNLGIISFAAPWVLAGAAALPLVWLLLRLTPPAVKRIDFPAIRLLFGLDPTARATAHTPPWLIILRLAILALVVLGLADPILNLDTGVEHSGPVVVVFDNGWAAATHWEDRAKALHGVIETADRRGQPVALVTTAPAMIPTTARMQSAHDAADQAARLAPLPWTTDRVAAIAQVKALAVRGPASAVWISDGVDSPGAGDLARALQAVGPLTVIDAGNLAPALVLYPPQRIAAAARSSTASADTSANDIQVKLARVPGGAPPATAVTVRAIDAENQVVAQTAVTFAGGGGSATARLVLPTELANHIARFDVEGVPSAATTVLADDNWQRRPVGIASATTTGLRAPLLENAYYLEQAMAPFADVRSGDLDDLLGRPLAVLIMADGGKLLDTEETRIAAWVDSGGLLVRFAGPGLESNVDSLLPVKLRNGGRTFGGAMSWSTPATLAPFPPNSPFKDLLAPDDVTVSSQVLAEPASDLAAHTWARLQDGTPLVTAARRGEGWVVLFHVTATPEWSKLPLSGLFVDMLKRMVDISHGVQDKSDQASGLLPPRTLLDGFGRLTQPNAAATPLAAQNFADIPAGPHAAPGLYGPPGETRALNLSSSLVNLAALGAPPLGATRTGFDSVAHERLFKPWLLTAALILLLADLALSFAFRRLWPAPRVAKSAAGLVLALLLIAPAGRAADNRRTAEIDPTVKAAILETRLAYFATGSADVDRIAASGLGALTQVLAARTSAEFAPPSRIDLTTVQAPDTLIPYPMIYWRINPAQKPPPERAFAAINAYLHRGGLVIFDAPDQAGAAGSDGKNEARLDELLRHLDIPPVARMADDHVLNRSFYLMHSLPGRYVGADVLVEQGAAANDGASSVIIGTNDWISAWAKDGNGVPLFAVIPGGEKQREQAYRTGVNMVMYALTGNYKSDQVHLPAIMQRLTQ